MSAHNSNDLVSVTEDTEGLETSIQDLSMLTGGATAGLVSEEISFQGLTDAMIMKYLPEGAQRMTSYVANQALFHFVTDVQCGISLVTRRN